MKKPVPIPLTCEVSRCPEKDLTDEVFLPLMLTTEGAAFCTAMTIGEYRLGNSWPTVDTTYNEAVMTATNFASSCGRKSKKNPSPHTLRNLQVTYVTDALVIGCRDCEC
jgi:hypothetical protein